MSVRARHVARLSLRLGLASVFLVGCEALAPPADEPRDGPVEGVNLGAVPANAPSDVPPGSVGDVSGGDRPPEPGASSAAVAGEARIAIRNATDARIDVTALFIRDDVTLRVSFLQVAPNSVSIAVGPPEARVIRLRAVTADNDAIPVATFTYGVDFDEVTPAEFVIDDSIVHPPGAPPTGGGPTDPDEPPGGGEEPPGTPPSINLARPAHDLELPLGSSFLARWTDFSAAPDAVVTIWMERVNGANPEQEPERFQMSSEVSERGDGINDEVRVLLQRIEPATYRVVARIRREAIVVESVAPGRITVFRDEGNAAPVIHLVLPADPVRIQNGQAVRVAWEDEDPDDNASITFALESSRASVDRLRHDIGTTVSEDPDGPGADEADIVVSGALPGRYDLVAVIDDGQFSGSSRLPGVVEVIGGPGNDPPTIEVREPADTLEVLPTDPVFVSWRDSDANDNAMISVLLDADPNADAPDGNEILLVSSVAEDPDGAGADDLVLALPEGLEPGDYRVLTTITDGSVEAFSFAPGLLHVRPDEGEPAPQPSAEIIGLESPLALRLGDVFGFTVEVRNVVEYDLGVWLSNGLVRLDARPAVVHTSREGSANMVSLDTGLLRIPNDLPMRWFDLEIEVLVRGRAVVRTAERAKVWVRQEVEIVHSAVVGVRCGDVGDPINPPATPGLEFRWYGGGFLTEGDVYAPVDFWLSLDGAWPPTDPSHVEPTYKRVVADVESPGVVVDVFVPWDEIKTLAPGLYGLVAVIHHPDYGEIIHVPNLDLMEICSLRPFGNGAMSEMPSP